RDMIAAAGDKRPFHLPPREQAIVGRDDELAAIHEQLADPDRRLCTLVGPGGIGKTRLALETGWRVAANHMGPFLHGVYFVPLAGVAIATQQLPAGVITQLVTAVAESLDFTFSGPRPPEQQLMQYLRHKSLLLILDNCEHLIDAVRDLAQMLFAQTEQVQLLVTSRERLHMGTEWMLAIDGLPYPPPTPADLDLEQYSAVQLFMQRAQQVDAGFVPNGENGRCGFTDIGRICRMVRGIPLAIELAVPWVRLLTCREIAQEIEQNLDALTTGMAHVPARHRSMRAVFEHSWSLLADSERQMVVRLSVFRGGFDRQAAESVAGASLAQLAVLLDKSLVYRLDGNSVVRYQMQEVLRQYAAEKLADSAAETAVFHQHSHYYLEFVTRRSADLRGQRQPEALDEIRHEIENIRAAWQYALDHDLFDLINEATDTLALFYYMRSWAAEGITLFAQAAERLAARQPSQPIALGKLRARQGWFAFLKGEHVAAQSLLQQSLDHLRTADATDEIVYPLNFLAVVTYTLGDYEAAYQLATEGLRLSEQLDDPYRIAIANNILSQIAYLQEDYDAAAQFCETSLDIERRI
ncbi:MAG: hypothetical protein KC421_11745, partial [Anaerolineales bacterium]|nr:hypothetical protein [Anaerolineales bacterium]